MILQIHCEKVHIHGNRKKGPVFFLIGEVIIIRKSVINCSDKVYFDNFLVISDGDDLCASVDDSVLAAEKEKNRKR